MWIPQLNFSPGPTWMTGNFYQFCCGIMAHALGKFAVFLSRSNLAAVPLFCVLLALGKHPFLMYGSDALSRFGARHVGYISLLLAGPERS
jgi:hypothetical protein